MDKKLVEMSELYDVYAPLLTDKQRDIFDSYYNNDLTLSEIADNESITRQAVRDAVLRSESVMREFESKLHLAEFIRNLSRSIEEINTQLRTIDDLNRHSYFDVRIDTAIKTIRALTEELSGNNKGENDGI